MATELEKKRRVRRGHRASATRLVTQAEEELKREEVVATKLKVLHTSLQEKLSRLKTLDSEIIDLIDDEEELITEIDQADVCSEKIQLIIFNIATVFEDLTPTLTEIAPFSDGRARGDSSNSSTTGSHSTEGSRPPSPHGEHGATPSRKSCKVKLPKIVLKKFDGNPLDWAPFWDTFESTVHANADLSDIDKFNYLSSLLERSAAEAIRGLALSSANYSEAVSILKRRFGDRQRIISKHMETLLHLEPVTNYSVKSLRHLYDEVESHVRSLGSLGINTESYGGLLASTLLNKLPNDIKLVVSRSVADGVWSIESFMKALEEEISARERTVSTQVHVSDSSNSSAWQKKSSRNIPTARTLLLPVPNMCSYCNQGHSSSNCVTVLDVENRKKILRQSGRCFNCLRKGHLGKDCHSTQRCRNCNGRHHTSICQRAPGSSTEKPHSPPAASPNSSGTVSTATSMYTEVQTPVLLQTATATVLNPDNTNYHLKVRIVFDGGSQRSYISQKARTNLHLNTEAIETVLIKTFGSSEEQAQLCDVVHLLIKTRDGGSLKIPLLCVPIICEPLAGEVLRYIVTHHPELRELDLADSPTCDQPLSIDVLIGADSYWKLVTGKVMHYGNCPTAIETQLGWVLSGPVKDQVNLIAHHSNSSSINLASTHTLFTKNCSQCNNELDVTLKQFWDLETLGIREGKEESLYEKLVKTICLKDGRYEVQLPWRENHPPVPSHYQMSLHRLGGLIKRLRDNPSLLAEYDAVIQDQLRRGIIEKVAELEGKDNGCTHYIPHHAVVRRDKETTKLRIVFDGSAKQEGPSLNECLYAGPSLYQGIFDILIRFRMFPVALIGDIEKAFLMVSVTPKDRDMLRFLWVDDIQKNEPEVVTFRFKRVVFGISSSPFLLNGTLKYHIERYHPIDPLFVNKFLRSIYVDDLVSGAKSIEESYDLYVKSKERLREGGFNLRRFLTNSPQLQSQIDFDEGQFSPDNSNPKVIEEDESYCKATLGSSTGLSQGIQKVLGVLWNVPEDQIIFDISHIAKAALTVKETKRGIASVSARFYDPLGVLAPCIVTFKLLLKQIWDSGLGWDDPLTPQLLSLWKKLVKELNAAKPVVIPRYCMSQLEMTSSLLHLQGFCDASSKAYAAVVYLQIETTAGCQSRFLASKTRVASKGQSIPRLELLSALLLARLLYAIKTALKDEVQINKQLCHTDSKASLYWITSQKEWKQFVQNRVNEIQRLVPIKCWRHCKGDDNPADLPSRGAASTTLMQNDMWLEGPQWMRTMVDPGSAHVKLSMDDPIIQREVKTTSVTLLTSNVSNSCSAILNCERYSSLCRLFRITARVMKFVKLLKHVQCKPEIDCADMDEARVYWLHVAQKILQKDKNFPDWSQQLGLFCDENGLWRCDGRLKEANIPETMKHPILLPRNYHLTTLIVRECHLSLKHGGVADTLAHLRTEYWIVKGRSFVRGIVRQCTVCRRFEGRPHQPPLPPALPKFRVSEEPAFTFSGIDFAGPLYLKGINEDKVWICLFTCAVTRAIHLEVVTSLSAQSFIRCLSRFVARRGLPKMLITDNAKTFTAAKQILREMLEDPAIKTYLLHQQIQWHFNLEKAPWSGGFFERLIGLVKRCLRKTLKRAKLSHDELVTLVTEVEGILNSRPLTYVSSEDLTEPLTPSHLIFGHRLQMMPHARSHLKKLDPEFLLKDSAPNVHKRLLYLNQKIEHFWTRWRKEYLVALRENHRYKSTVTKCTIKKGEVCVVYEPNCPRAFWRLARVEQLIPSHDGQIRGAVVKTITNKGGVSVLRRPVKHLYPLELLNDEICDQETQLLEKAENSDTPEESEISQNPSINERPVRAAAMKARERIKQIQTV